MPHACVSLNCMYVLSGDPCSICVDVCHAWKLSGIMNKDSYSIGRYSVDRQGESSMHVPSLEHCSRQQLC